MWYIALDTESGRYDLFQPPEHFQGDEGDLEDLVLAEDPDEWTCLPSECIIVRALPSGKFRIIENSYGYDIDRPEDMVWLEV